MTFLERYHRVSVRQVCRVRETSATERFSSEFFRWKLKFSGPGRKFSVSGTYTQALVILRAAWYRSHMATRQSPSSPQVVIADDNARACFDLRKKGYSQTAIGEQLGITQSAVSRCLKRYLEKLRAEILEDAEEVRAMELERLDAMLVPMLRLATEEGDPQSVDRALRIMERRAKLLGLDAPTRTEIKAEVTARADYSRLDPLELEAMIELEKKALGE